MKINHPAFRFFLLLMSLIMLTSVFCVAHADDITIDAGAMVLTKTATIPDGISFISGGIIANYETQDGSRKVQILNQNGEAFNDQWYDDVYSIISDGSCIVYNTSEDNTRLYGVVDSVREQELLPCEAIDVRKLSDRFLLICYMTDAGTPEDYFGSYYSYKDSSMIEYKGYAQILDLEKGQIVPGLEITTSYIDASVTGNMIFEEVSYKEINVYTADGVLVGCYEYLNAYPDSSIALQSVAEGICVYDQNMNMVSLLEADSYYDYEPIDGISEMLMHRFVNEENKYMYCVTDLHGNTLTNAYSYIASVDQRGYLCLYNRDTQKYSLVNFAGVTLIADVDSLSYVAPGYFIAEIDSEGYYIYDLTGKKLNDTAYANHQAGLIFTNDNHRVIVCETGEEIAADGYAHELYGSLVKIGSVVYDVFTGKVVLSDVDACVATGSSLYVWDNETETYTRYIAEFK